MVGGERFMQNDLGKFKISYKDQEDPELHSSEFDIEYAIRNCIHNDPEVKEILTKLEILVSSNIQVISQKTGHRFTPQVTLTDWNGRVTLPIKVTGVKDQLLSAAAQVNADFDARTLGAVHLGLLELEFAGGSKLTKDLWNPTWKLALNNTYRRRRRRAALSIDIQALILNKLISREEIRDDAGRVVSKISLAAGGKLFLIEKQKESAPNLNSFELKDAFFRQGVGDVSNDGEFIFYQCVLDKFDYIKLTPFSAQLNAQPNMVYTLTKKGQKYFDKQIIKYLLSHSWRANKNWKDQIKVDHKLVNSVPGIGATLLSKTNGGIRDYIKYLLSNTLEQVVYTSAAYSQDPYYKVPVSK